jgi:hypothetical protein
LHRNDVEMLIEPQISEIAMLDWKAFERIVEAGYRQTIESLEKHKGSLLVS